MELRHAVRVAAGCLLAPGLAAAWPGSARAQFVEPPAPAAYALFAVTVVHADGTRATGQTLVVRAGRIENVGAGVAVPADAHVLDGDSLFVYPGMIDAAGELRHEFPRDSVDRSRLRSWDAPRSVQGFTPSRRMIDALRPRETELVGLRRKGVVAVAVHPADPLLPGRGALLLLRAGVTAPNTLALDPVLGPVLSLGTGRSAYPSTRMGAVAWYRQTLLDAQRHAELTRLAGADPRSTLPPAYDPDYDVLQQIMRADARVFAAVDDADDIRRVLRLADEFGLRLVILGGAEAWQVAGELRARNVPVLASLDFPEPRRWKPDTDANGNGDPAAERERRDLEARYANGARLAEAGVTFAFVSNGRADLRDGARRAIEYGLAENAALRALTSTPAALLGVPHLARVETGLPATFVVTDGPLFDKDTRVRYTFVEGSLERGAAARARRDGEPDEGEPAAHVAGRWTVDVTGPYASSFTMQLAQDGETVSGTMDGSAGSTSVTGTIRGNALRLTTTISIGGQTIDLGFVGTVTGDEAGGTLETAMGNVAWSARRIEELQQ